MQRFLIHLFWIMMVSHACKAPPKEDGVYFDNRDDFCMNFKNNSDKIFIKNHSFQFYGINLRGNIPSLLGFKDSTLQKMDDSLIFKGCYKIMGEHDSLHIFKYGWADKKLKNLKELRFRILKGNELQDDKAVISIGDNPALNYDYFVMGNHIHVTITNKQREIHDIFFKITGDTIQRISDYPKGFFHKDWHHNLLGKRVRVYNEFKNKKLILNKEDFGRIEGKTIASYGEKGAGDYYLVELDKKSKIQTKYVSFLKNNLFHPRSLYALDSPELEEVGAVILNSKQMPKQPPVKIAEDVFVEIIK